MRLLCERPHVKDVDFANERFVVSTAVGLELGGPRLEMGDEVPHGALGAYALQCEYDRPLCRIELLEYAMGNPELREACARRGVPGTCHNCANPPHVGECQREFIPTKAETTVITFHVGEKKTLLEQLTPEQRDQLDRAAQAARRIPKDDSKSDLPDIQKLNREQLVALCEQSGIPTDGTKNQLRKRLAELAGLE
jgi:hypothetical protein